MFRSFRYPLRPNSAQEAVLDRWRTACQQLYNGALQHRRDAWRKQRVHVGYAQQCAELTALRASDPAWAEVPVWIARSALRRVDLAFKSFFRRVKSGQTPGFPRFRSRDRYDSFDLGPDPSRIASDRVILPKLGAVKFHMYRDLRGEVRLTRVGRSAHGWYVTFVCDVGAPPPKVPVRSAIGVDVGLEAFATLSCGERVENPRFFRAGESVLARRQRSLARKRRGSNSRKRAKQLVTLAHEHVRNQRLDFVRKLSCGLFARFDLIAHEDLSIAGMARGSLGKSINDAAWGLFIDALNCKAEGAGKWSVPTNPYRSSIDCSGCGESVPKDLSQREHRCPRCGLVLHRDENAARNVLARGLRAVQLTEVPELQEQNRTARAR